MSFLKGRFCSKKKSPSKLSPAAPIEPELTPLPGRRVSPIHVRKDSSFTLSRFTIEKKIGRGQFSEVYKAMDEKHGHHVALKKIGIFEMMDAKARLDCIKEINLLQQLDHPNIIKHLGSFIDGNDLYIVLELAGGGDLSKLISYFAKEGKLIPERTIWKYFSQISDALSHMHEKRVMHRDIKPANIFVTDKGVPKLGDLGLGRFFSNFTKDAHSLVGTPYYMSPERVKECGYDFKSDIWSMGCILYELEALQSPFFGEKMNLYSLVKKIESCSYPPLPSDKYSDTLRHMIQSCLNLDPSQRPSAAEIAKIARRMNDSCSSSSAAMTRC
jgi:NIMA (never in mitosis gene a)-related kinase